MARREVLHFYQTMKNVIGTSQLQHISLGKVDGPTNWKNKEIMFHNQFYEITLAVRDLPTTCLYLKPHNSRHKTILLLFSQTASGVGSSVQLHVFYWSSNGMNILFNFFQKIPSSCKLHKFICSEYARNIHCTLTKGMLTVALTSSA